MSFCYNLRKQPTGGWTRNDRKGETLRLLLLDCGVVDEAGDHELLVGHRGFEFVVVDLPVPVHVDLPEALVHLAAQVSSPHPEPKEKKGKWDAPCREFLLC